MSRLIASCALAALLPLRCWSEEPPAPPAPPVQPAPAPPAPLALSPISFPRPAIPDEACQQRLSGYVDLDFAVLPDGNVADVRVAKSELKGVFDGAAVEAVSAWIYPPQAAPVKMHQRLPLSFADCRAEQLRAAVPADGAAPAQEDCPALAAQARQLGDPIESSQSGRDVLTGETAQVYSAPSAHCYLAGKNLKPGGRLTAYVEYRGFSLVSPARKKVDAAVWVRSSQLKDMD